MMLPREFVIENNNMDTFINTVFPDLHQNFSNTEYNSDVDFINHKIGESIHGFSKTYYSADSVGDAEGARLLPNEFLNWLPVNKLPAHK
ncbi:hypothetical protein O9G_005614 [Rozella allomycis CSF55]|uniref:Uncharacterized protein n=1 Tax=Rozella allomycis (strain CSF55) TaxID=988480 RepID=A0A075B2T8_ROZAC|nr:hypothetical protein O9G_005614 [Rozella allomycis CSF55]|eukprot:EPZ36922.1 hypothetical protein O9G_005614 [Rozella allomycis CSF55]